MKEMRRNCSTCKLLLKCETLQNNEKYQKVCQQGFGAEYDFLENLICDKYVNIYIEYPIEVSDINFNNPNYQNTKSGKFVKIRPCADEYKGKTYLGLHLGDLPIKTTASHNPETKELTVNLFTKPAIFVFDLKKVIYGFESWWGIIKSEDDLKQITNQDIDNIWYVKALNALNQAEEAEKVVKAT